MQEHNSLFDACATPKKKQKKKKKVDTALDSDVLRQKKKQKKKKKKVDTPIDSDLLICPQFTVLSFSRTRM